MSTPLQGVLRASADITGGATCDQLVTAWPPIGATWSSAGPGNSPAGCEGDELQNRHFGGVLRLVKLAALGGIVAVL